MRRQRWFAAFFSLAMSALVAGAGLAGIAGQTHAQEGTPAATPLATPIASPAATPVAMDQAASVVVTGRWWIDVISAVRAPAVPALELESRTGRDWIVVIADISNWSGKRATFKTSG